MRIDPQIPAAENSGTNRVSDSQSGAARRAAGVSAGEPSDTVQLSSDSATVGQLVSQLSQVPEVRQGLVASLRSEIQSGQFQRSNDQIAGAIVSQLLGGSASG